LRFGSQNANNPYKPAGPYELLMATIPENREPLVEWGWDASWENELATIEVKNWDVGRVLVQQRGFCTAMTAKGITQVMVPGKAFSEGKEWIRKPAVGDWVLVSPSEQKIKGLVEFVLPRRTKFSRQSAGKRSVEQVIAANIDSTWIVQSMEHRINKRRLERYLTVVQESGSLPIFVLTKSDLVDDPDAFHAEVRSLAGNAQIFPISSIDGTGIDQLQRTMRAKTTVALFGPSGSGKSTLINKLAGDTIQETGEVRGSDKKGRHTTTRRELIRLSEGSLLIDTPGIRELQLWDVESGVDDAFLDIEAISANCRFRDCAHIKEPGCAVRSAIEDGTLAKARVESYWKLKREAKAQSLKMGLRANLEQMQYVKRLTSQDTGELRRRRRGGSK
jgi:ribosome biogenesis GTPase